ncbi:MAG: PQQ-dependent sugar dehydrogenase [Phycisphaerales bacterium]
MRTRTTLLAALLTAAISSLLISQRAVAQGATSLWDQHCLTCHGERGQGGGAGTRTLLTEPLRSIDLDRRFFDSIKQGVPDTAMTAFGETLSDKQIWGLVVHLRELQERDRRGKEGSPKPDSAGVFESKHHRYKVETVVPGGVDVPWSVDFLPAKEGEVSGRMLVTGRSGDLRVHTTGKAGGKLSEPVRGTPQVRNRGQGGLMDVAVHPDHAENGWVYLAYSEELKQGGRSAGMTTIVRGKLVERGAGGGGASFAWTDNEVIFRAKPEHFTTGDLHFGCRIVFSEKQAAGGGGGGRRYLYFAVGERGRMEMAQDLTKPNGKVHRVWDDGKVPDDNPFVSSPVGAYSTIWSYGHRNPQGLAFDLDGVLWDTEHGPRGGDEVNRVERGANYGWPLVSYGINYNDAPFATPWAEDAQGAEGKVVVSMPVFHWTPSIGACGLDVSRGPMFAKWKGDLLAGGLSGENVDRLRVRDGKVVEREELLHGRGRVRDVVCGPDGSVYVVLNDPDRVVRIIEVE